MTDKKTKEIIEKNAVLLCKKLDICTVDTFGQLPDVLQRYFSTLTHVEVCQYLVWCDRNDGLSFGTISIKYALSRRQVMYICFRLDKAKKNKGSGLLIGP